MSYACTANIKKLQLIHSEIKYQLTAILKQVFAVSVYAMELLADCLLFNTKKKILRTEA